MKKKGWFGSFSGIRSRSDEEEKILQTEIGHFSFSCGKMKNVTAVNLKYSVWSKPFCFVILLI